MSSSSVDAPQRRGGKTFDTLSGHSFGTSKRFNAKRNFDEIDSAGFNDFTKRNFDEIDRAGFNDLSKRNFDEIDSAGFNDLSKRNFDEIDNAGFKDYLRKRNFDEIDAAGFNDFSKRMSARSAVARQDSAAYRRKEDDDMKGKRNFDEIDAAGFNDFSKRFDDEFAPFSLRPGSNDGSGLKFPPIDDYLYTIRYKIHEKLVPYYEQYKKYQENTPGLLSKRAGGDDYPPDFSKINVGKYNAMPPKYAAYYGAKQGDYPAFYPSNNAPYTPSYTPSYTPPNTPPYTHSNNFPNTPLYRPPYHPTKPELTYDPAYFNFLLKAIKYYKNKGMDDPKNASTPPKDDPGYYSRTDSKRAEYKRNDDQTTEPKTQR